MAIHVRIYHGISTPTLDRNATCLCTRRNPGSVSRLLMHAAQPKHCVIAPHVSVSQFCFSSVVYPLSSTVAQLPVHQTSVDSQRATARGCPSSNGLALLHSRHRLLEGDTVRRNLILWKNWHARQYLRDRHHPLLSRENRKTRCSQK